MKLLYIYWASISIHLLEGNFNECLINKFT